MKFVGNVTVYPFLNQNDVGNIMLTPGGNITQNQIDQNRTPNITNIIILWSSPQVSVIIMSVKDISLKSDYEELVVGVIISIESIIKPYLS